MRIFKTLLLTPDLVIKLSFDIVCDIRDRFILVNQFSIKIDRNLKFLCRTVFKAMLLPRLFLIDIRNRFRKINLFFPESNHICRRMAIFIVDAKHLF